MFNWLVQQGADLDQTNNAGETPRLLALQSGEVDMLDAVPVVLSPALRANPDIDVLRVRSANHRQLHMRCDAAPFSDKRVRQALAGRHH